MEDHNDGGIVEAGLGEIAISLDEFWPKS